MSAPPTTNGRPIARDVSFRETIDETLRSAFGLDSFRKGQRAVIESVIAGHDTIAVMPTGSGKSLCYQLPAVISGRLVVVVTPLISLMRDQVRSLLAQGISAGCLYSGQSREEKLEVFSRLRTAGSHLLYLSPERIQSPGFAPWIRERNVALIAVDEAHCVSQWGPEFRQDYHRLDLLREIKPDVPILALTATATPDVLRDIAKRLQLREPKRHVYGFYRPNLFYQVETVADDSEKFAFLTSALRRHPRGRILVYCGTRRQCESVALELGERFDQVGYYHAGLSTDERSRVQTQYECGEIRILAATNAFGMGMDYPDVRLVVHMQMPASVEAYYQEVGRAGRDGQRSLCLLLYARKDKGLHTFFIRESKADLAVIRQRWRSLEAIVSFVEGGECRHAGILTYFRDTERIANCGHCDVCAPRDEIRVPSPERALVLANTVRVRRSTKTVDRVTESRPLTSEEEIRASVLKDWRRAYASERDIAAFVVFSNRTLNELAQRNPRDLGELARVHGFGPKRIEQIGEDVIRVLRDST